MTNQIQSVSFHNQQITVLNHNSKPYVAMKSIVENIGLDWTAQLQRIKRHKVLSSGVVMITTPSNQGKQDYVCLPISMINGWLFGIDTNRVKLEIRATLEQYQLECFDVLYNHFMPKIAQQFPNTINEEQQYSIRKAVDDRVYRTGEKHQAIYHKFYDQFKIPRYQELPANKFDEAIKFLGGVSLSTKLSDEDWYDLAWLFKAANKMRYEIEQVEPALRLLCSDKKGAFYSMSVEYKRTLENARLIIERGIAHISDRGLINKWNHVLPVIRYTPKKQSN